MRIPFPKLRRPNSDSPPSQEATAARKRILDDFTSSPNASARSHAHLGALKVVFISRFARGRTCFAKDRVSPGKLFSVLGLSDAHEFHPVAPQSNEAGFGV
jgi:hypothetical protein